VDISAHRHKRELLPPTFFCHLFSREAATTSTSTDKHSPSFPFFPTSFSQLVIYIFPLHCYTPSMGQWTSQPTDTSTLLFTTNSSRCFGWWWLPSIW
jgi:hypothetical protein